MTVGIVLIAFAGFLAIYSLICLFMAYCRELVDAEASKGYGALSLIGIMLILIIGVTGGGCIDKELEKRRAEEWHEIQAGRK